MIDLHCHIIPGIDDGAQTIEESTQLVKHAVESGITHMVCTPHIQLGRFDNTKDGIHAAYMQLQQHIQAENIAMQLAFAAEVRICPEIMILAKQQKLPFLGRWDNKDVLLLELPHSHIPAGTEQLIGWLHKNGIVPMIAHPERNREILANPDKFQMLRKQQCLFQLTASSLIGDFGEGPLTLAEQFLQEDWITVIATDTHNLKRRPPKMREAKLATEKLVGKQKAQQLVNDSPWAISQHLF